MEEYYLESTVYTPLEKTFICLIASYLNKRSIALDTTDWNELCNNYFCIKYELVEPLVEQSILYPNKTVTRIVFIDEVVIVNDYNFFCDLIECIIYYREIRNNLKKILIDNSFTALKNNYSLYRAICHLISMMNVISGTFECMLNNAFSRDNAPQSFETFKPYTYINFYEACILLEGHFQLNKNYLTTSYLIFNYHILSHVNAMYSLIIFQVLKSSQFFDKDTNIVSKTLYTNLHLLFKDARVINILCNLRYFDINIPVEQRDRYNNTTRLEFIYGYDNFDIYSLRLDAAHDKIDFFHFNNTSPRKIKYNPITQAEYNELLLSLPNATNCFISYGKLWFVKESYRDNLEPMELTLFENTLKGKEHLHVLNNTISERSISAFLSVVKDLLYPHFNSNVDFNGETKHLLFRFDKMMFFLNLYFINALDGVTTPSQTILFDSIIEIAIELKLLDIEIFEQTDQIDAFDILSYIIECSKDTLLRHFQ